MLNTKNKNKGQVLVFAALSMLVFLGFAALAIDFGFFYHTKNQLQGAADAAALAGAPFLTCENDTGTVFQNQTTARRMAWQFACKNKAAQKDVFLVMSSSCDNPPSGGNLNNGNDAAGDIVVGFWDGVGFHEANGGTGNRINAVKAVARREEGKPYTGGGVVRFFGQIFNTNRQDITTTATAQGCVTLSPISVNEYWLGDKKISTDTGETSCQNPRNPDNTDGGRVPYGRHHLYPNSFVRPPCGDYINGYTDDYSKLDNQAGNRCKDPINGNGNIDPFGTFASFTSFQTLSCDPPGPTGADTLAVYPNPNCGTPGTNCIYPNGPLGSAACASDDVECKKGRVIVTFNNATPSAPTITPSLTAGRVFAVVGSDALSNAGAAGNMLSLIDLDFRSNCSKDNPDGCETWFSLPDFTPESNANSNPDKKVVAGYIRSGIYPNEIPIHVDEVYQSLYENVTNYNSDRPYASTSFFSGNGVVGPLVKANFYDNNYADGKYAPGKKIIVTVYDGIVNGNGSQARTTIVGFASVTIFGYGRGLQLDSNGIPSISDKFNPTTMYGYVEAPEDFEPIFEELEAVRTPARLVQ